MPICNKCNKEKTEQEFSWKHKDKGILQKKCKECTAAYGKIHYSNNKESYVSKAKANRHNEYQKTKNLIEDLKKHCEICNEDWIGALDFHHVDPSAKEHNVSLLRSRKLIKKEAEKCIILCSNCHRKFHTGHETTIARVAQLVEASGSNPL